MELELRGGNFGADEGSPSFFELGWFGNALLGLWRDNFGLGLQVLGILLAMLKLAYNFLQLGLRHDECALRGCLETILAHSVFICEVPMCRMRRGHLELCGLLWGRREQDWREIPMFLLAVCRKMVKTCVFGSLVGREQGDF